MYIFGMGFHNTSCCSFVDTSDKDSRKWDLLFMVMMPHQSYLFFFICLPKLRKYLYVVQDFDSSFLL